MVIYFRILSQQFNENAAENYQRFTQLPGSGFWLKVCPFDEEIQFYGRGKEI